MDAVARVGGAGLDVCANGLLAVALEAHVREQGRAGQREGACAGTEGTDARAGTGRARTEEVTRE